MVENWVFWIFLQKRRLVDGLSNVNDIPVAKLDLDIPLQVSGERKVSLQDRNVLSVMGFWGISLDVLLWVVLVGLQSSDKYLKEMRLREQERRNKKISKKKKRKRGKKGRKESDSEEDDIPALQAVSSAYDLPEVSWWVAPLENDKTENFFRPKCKFENNQRRARSVGSSGFKVYPTNGGLRFGQTRRGGGTTNINAESCPQKVFQARGRHKVCTVGLVQSLSARASVYQGWLATGRSLSLLLEVISNIFWAGGGGEEKTQFQKTHTPPHFK